MCYGHCYDLRLLLFGFCRIVVIPFTDVTVNVSDFLSGVPYHISVQEINNVLALIQQLKIKHAALTGGEPILHLCFKGILKSLRSIVDNVTVFTNGIALKSHAHVLLLHSPYETVVYFRH